MNEHVDGAIQFSCSDDIDENLSKIERLVRVAARRGARLVVLQELFEVLMSVAKVGSGTGAELEIKDPVADCGLVKKLKGV